MSSAIQSARSWGRLALGLTVLFTALLLVSCGSSATPTPTQEATPAPQPTQTPTPKPTATPTPAKTPQILVGSIESIDGDALSVVTVDGVITVTLGKDTIIRRFAAGSLGDLSVGQRVSLGGQRSEEGVAARQVAVTPEGTSLYPGTDVQERRANLVGSIESIEGSSITVKTEQGSFVAIINAEQTSIQLPSVASREDLSPGQLITVTGRESEEGGIAATSILITPDIGNLLRGKQGGGRTREAGEGRETQTETPIAVFDPERKAGKNEGITFVVTQGSEATFTVEERLYLLPLPNHAVMRTTALSGQIHLDGRPSVIEIDLLQLTSDQSLREEYVRTRIFGEHPTAVFTIEDVRPLPGGFTDGKEVTGKVTGLLNIRGLEVPLSFDIEARDDGDVIFILGRTSLVWSDFGMTAPMNIVTTVKDEIEVEILLAVRPLLDSRES